MWEAKKELIQQGVWVQWDDAREENEVDGGKQPDFVWGPGWGWVGAVRGAVRNVGCLMDGRRESLRNTVTGILWVGEKLAYSHVLERVLWYARVCWAGDGENTALNYTSTFQSINYQMIF